MDKRDRIKIASDTLKILENGYYINPENKKRVYIDVLLDNSVKNSSIYYEDDLNEVLNKVTECKDKTLHDTKIQVMKGSTLEITEQLHKQGNLNIAVLNFASAKKPGGGFENGAQAQEESLARSSGLILTLEEFSSFYNHNSKDKTCLYLSNMIYSHKVPFFRRDDGSMLLQPYEADVITMPAVNAGVAKNRIPKKNAIETINNIMYSRIQYIIAISIHKKIDTLVLGAWGCGVFNNDPYNVANLFKRVIQDPIFENRIKNIVFAILDDKTYTIFDNILMKNTR